jgi:hypothetical protein
VQKDRAGAIAAFKHVQPSSKVYAKALYNTACAQALLGNAKLALETVQKSFAAGMKREWAISDPDLVSIRADIEKLR